MKARKALPLLPEEERKLYPRGLPVHPQQILHESYGVRHQARAWLVIFGGKSQPLINNYYRMKMTAHGIFFLILYFALFVAWFPAFGIGFLLIQRLATTGEANILALLLCIAVILLMPIFPYIIAWVQTEAYEKWHKTYEQTRTAYLSHQG